MDIPCKQCPVLAVCVSRNRIECVILDKWVSRGWKSFMQIKKIRIFLRKEYCYRSGNSLELYNDYVKR